MSQQAQQQYLPKISVKDIQDVYLRNNFQALQDYFTTQNQLMSFKFFEVIFTKATDNYKLAHGFSYAPEDILITKLVGTGSLTFNYGLFDSKNLDLSVTGACRVRFFAGSYWNYETKTAPVSTDEFQVSPTVAAVVTEIINYTTVNNITNVFSSSSSGSSSVNRVSTTGAYLVKNTDDYVICTGTTNYTLTLFAAVTGTKPVSILNKGSGVVTLARAGVDLIDNETSQTVMPMTSVTLLPDGLTNFWVD